MVAVSDYRINRIYEVDSISKVFRLRIFAESYGNRASYFTWVFDFFGIWWENIVKISHIGVCTWYIFYFRILESNSMISKSTDLMNALHLFM